ncbi:MAG: GTPase [Lachnospiraceae bacterium]|nr:GTPase [Lachnospiraceae bacterium]MDE7052046.1 GTPase [Lachnospiraceae bacterium]
MFNRKKKEMMVYVILGFLEAGKTSLIRDLVTDDMFDGNAKTLILACEEGEEEYTQEVLQKGLSACEYIEDEDSFNGKIFEKFLKKHRPDRLIIEYNGMWPVKHIPQIYDELEDICFDSEVVFQTLAVVNDETFALYMKNMPSMMVEHFKVSQMVIINRCSLETNKRAIRGSIKAVNPSAQIVYESEDDAFYEMKEEMPFDINADVINIEDDDFGLWYIDMTEHQENYNGKTLKVTGMIQKAPGLPKEFVVFGRFAMTCCADDVQYMGFLCKADSWKEYKNKQYVTVTARMEYKYMKEYGEEGPVFYAEEVEEAEKPKEELVYFN